MIWRSVFRVGISQKVNKSYCMGPASGSGRRGNGMLKSEIPGGRRGEFREAGGGPASWPDAPPAGWRTPRRGSSTEVHFRGGGDHGPIAHSAVKRLRSARSGAAVLAPAAAGPSRAHVQ